MQRQRVPQKRLESLLTFCKGRSMNKYEKIEAYLVQFLKDEVAKAGFSKVVLGISGGIDSAVVAVLAHKAFKDNLLGILLPASTSSRASHYLCSRGSDWGGYYWRMFRNTRLSVGSEELIGEQ